MNRQERDFYGHVYTIEENSENHFEISFSGKLISEQDNYEDLKQALAEIENKERTLYHCEKEARAFAAASGVEWDY